jgi:hypothetical protein
MHVALVAFSELRTVSRLTIVAEADSPSSAEILAKGRENAFSDGDRATGRFG